VKLNETPQLPYGPESEYDKRLATEFYKLLRLIAQKVNGIASGSVNALDGGATSVPTVGTWAQGDFVRNLNPTELGTAGSKYVLNGWSCVAGGTPGTWVQRRFLTGN
jgi:hypothetical protein